MKARHIRRWAAGVAVAALATVGIVASNGPAFAAPPVNNGDGTWTILTGDPVALHDSIPGHGCNVAANASDPATLSGPLTFTEVGTADNEPVTLWMGDTAFQGFRTTVTSQPGDHFVQITVPVGGNGTGFTCAAGNWPDGNLSVLYINGSHPGIAMKLLFSQVD